MAQGVFVISEQTEGKFRKVTFEIVSEGRRIVDEIGGELTVALLGSNVEQMAAELGQYGTDKVLIIDDPVIADYTPEAYVSIIEKMIKSCDPALVLAGATTQGKDLVPRLAARLDVGLAMECIRISAANGKLTFSRPMYGGKLIAGVVIEGYPKVASVPPNVMPITKNPRQCAVKNQNVIIGAERATIKEKHFENNNKVELTEADVIVSGGYGTRSDFGVLEDLAAAFKGAVGASRSAVDEGWRPHSDQVGQTGKVVSPKLYIACGISGAIQHMAGISGSKIIVAINKDPDAPIFSKADFGIVGDLFEIVPAITAEIRESNS